MRKAANQLVDAGYVIENIGNWNGEKRAGAQEAVPNDPLETLEQTKDQFPETQIIALSGPLALEHRLQAINSGADSFITRPVHLSAIAQSILLSLSKNAGGGEPLSATGAAMPALGVANELEPIGEDDPNTPVDLLDDDLNLSEELDLIDEEF